MTRHPIDPGASHAAGAAERPPFPLIKQGDGRWGGKRLGLPMSNGSERTLAQSGCMVASLEMLKAHLVKRPPVALDIVNDMLVLRGCFDGPLLFVEKAARELGVSAPASDRVRGTLKEAQRLAETVRQVFDDGRVAILHVDHDGTSSKGDPYGDHFIAAFARIGDRYLCGDPATGELIDIDVAGSGTSIWQTSKGVVEKHYQVVGVIPVSL